MVTEYNYILVTVVCKVLVSQNKSGSCVHVIKQLDTNTFIGLIFEYHVHTTSAF